MINLYIITLTFLIFIFFIFGSIKIYDDIKKYLFIKNFSSYISTLNYFQELSYETIYKDRILTYSMEAIKLDDVDYSAVIKDYAILTKKTMGPIITNKLIDMFGGEEFLNYNIMDYFSKKYDNDTIRNTAFNNISGMSNDEVNWDITKSK